MERKEDWTPEISRAIVDGLRKRVRAEAVRRGDGIVEHVGKNWISWRSRKRGLVFAEIRSLRGRIQVFILPRPHELHNGGGLARRAPRSQGWGWFRSRLEISSIDQVEGGARLIAQSYEDGVRRGNRGRSTRRDLPPSR